MATELADLAIAGVKTAAEVGTRLWAGARAYAETRRFRYRARRRSASAVHLANDHVTIEPLSQADEAFAWDEGRGDHTRAWCSMPTSSHSLIRSSPEPVVRYTRFRWTLWHFWFFTLLTDLD